MTILLFVELDQVTHVAAGQYPANKIPFFIKRRFAGVGDQLPVGIQNIVENSLPFLDNFFNCKDSLGVICMLQETDIISYNLVSGAWKPLINLVIPHQYRPGLIKDQDNFVDHIDQTLGIRQYI